MNWFSIETWKFLWYYLFYFVLPNEFKFFFVWIQFFFIGILVTLPHLIIIFFAVMFCNVAFVNIEEDYLKLLWPTKYNHFYLFLLWFLSQFKHFSLLIFVSIPNIAHKTIKQLLFVTHLALIQLISQIFSGEIKIDKFIFTFSLIWIEWKHSRSVDRREIQKIRNS